jgi:hypothetical protein
MATSWRSPPSSVLIWPLLALILIPVLAPVSSPPDAAKTAQAVMQGPITEMHVFVAVGQSNMSGQGSRSG